jgi:4-carboxymuconolactone decarboxylase
MPRLTPIASKDQVAPEYHGVVDGIVASHGPLQGPYSVFLYAPELAGRLAHAGSYIRFESRLDERVRNLAALTTAREFDCLYVWGAQSGAARRRGIPDSTIDAVRAKTTAGIPAEDALIVGFTQRLIRDHRVDDTTVQALRDRLGDQLLIELTSTIGYYSMVAMSLNTIELDPAPGAEVLNVG